MSGTGVGHIGLPAFAAGVVESRRNSPSPVMKPMFTFPAPESLPAATFGPETAVFRLKTPPPSGAGATPKAPGAAVRRAGAAMRGAGMEFRERVAPPSLAGAEFQRLGSSVHGMGAALRRLGAAPMACTGAPAAWRVATFSCSGHPAPRGCVTSEGSVRAPLCSQPFALCST